jgi:hypothetical protein
MWSRFVAALTASIICADSLAGQPLPPAETPRHQADIVVTGTRDYDDRARKFVDAVATPTRFNQLATFEQPVCPMVLGMRPSSNAMATARMRQIASSAGMMVDQEGCDGNALVFVTSDRKALMALLRRHQAHLFGERTRKEIDALEASAAPAVAWQVVEPRGADGRTMERVSDIELVKGRRARVDAYILRHVSVSRLGAKTRVDFLASVLILDARALLGTSTDQIAAYSAMRLFAGATPPDVRSGTAPTILTLFDDRAGGLDLAPSLTDWDAGFLRALYAIPHGYFAHQQQGRIAEMLSRSLMQRPAKPDSSD